MAFIGDTTTNDWREAANNFLITAKALTLYQKTAAPYFENLGGESELARTFRAAALVGNRRSTKHAETGRVQRCSFLKKSAKTLYPVLSMFCTLF